MTAIRVTLWNEFRHDRTKDDVRALYPMGLHAIWKQILEEHLGDGMIVRTATLDEPDHGLGGDVLPNTDVMVWRGHMFHADVIDAIAAKVAQRVREGMGLIVLHSAHYAKPFKLLMGTNCHLKWREAAERERVWNVAPGHPITAGLSRDFIDIEHEEMYGEHFDVPDPDELIFVSWFKGGNIFRSGCVWRRGAGRVFYFRPGHESFPTFYHPDVRRVIANGVRYVAPHAGVIPYRNSSPHAPESLSPIAQRPHPTNGVHRPGFVEI